MIREVNLNSIVTGWFNWAKDQLGLLDEETKKLAESRLKICETCTNRKTNQCGLCGCMLTAKTKDPNAKCPDNPNKW